MLANLFFLIFVVRCPAEINTRFNLESGGTGTLVSRIQLKIRVGINKFYLVLLIRV